jgi:hypothetical protein
MPAEALLFDLELFLTDSRRSLQRIHLLGLGDNARLRPKQIRFS